MKLKLERIDTNRLTIQREFEEMGQGLLLVRVASVPKYPTPLHWRLVDGKKPPLDISLNPSTGVFDSLKFFFMDEKIVLSNPDVQDIKVDVGSPTFDTSIWTKDQYLVDMEGEFIANFYDEQVFLRFNSDKITNGVALDSSTYLLFNEDSEFCGVLLRELNENELKALTDSRVI